MKTLIHFHEQSLVNEGNRMYTENVKRTVEWDEEILQQQAFKLLVEAGFKPVDNRVMVEYS